MTVLRGTALTKTYGSAHALAAVSIDIAAGESVAIMGPSGSGKSTLLHVLAGILRPDSGQVLLGADDIGRMSDADRTRLRRSRFGFVFQFGQLVSELPNVENVALPLMLGGVSRAEAIRRAGSYFAPLGLDGLQNRRPGEISGGQAQRVAIARALAIQPDVIFADEPTGALDQASGHEVMSLLTASARQNGTALVVVTHDREVARWSDRTVAMRDGRIEAEFRRPAEDVAR